MLLWVVQDRIALAATVGAVGVFAKEFAAAPLWIGVGYAILVHRRDLFWRCSAAAVTATLIWVALQIALILRFNYSYGGSASALVFEGGNFTRWFRLLGPTQSLGALAVHVVPVVALAAAAVRRARASCSISPWLRYRRCSRSSMSSSPIARSGIFSRFSLRSRRCRS